MFERVQWLESTGRTHRLTPAVTQEVINTINAVTARVPTGWDDALIIRLGDAAIQLGLPAIEIQEGTVQTTGGLHSLADNSPHSLLNSPVSHQFLASAAALPEPTYTSPARTAHTHTATPGPYEYGYDEGDWVDWSPPPRSARALGKLNERGARRARINANSSPEPMQTASSRTDLANATGSLLSALRFRLPQTPVAHLQYSLSHVSRRGDACDAKARLCDTLPGLVGLSVQVSQ